MDSALGSPRGSASKSHVRDENGSSEGRGKGEGGRTAAREAVASGERFIPLPPSPFPPSYPYSFLSRRARWCVYHRSLRQSPGGSTPFSCHCTRRCVLVKEPSSSGTVAAGRKNTSVWIAAGLSTSGA